MQRVFSSAKKRFDLLLRDLAGEPRGPRFRLLRWILVPLLVIGVLTAFGRFTGFDLGAAKAIYLAGENSWSFGQVGFWQFFYHYGTIPAAIILLLSLVGYAASWSIPRFRKWRRVFLFVVLSFAISSGVITNFILKEYWGRPRPRQLLIMGGHQNFEPVLTYDPSSKGKSFPCGHATTGFFFLGGFFLLRRHRRELAWGFLILGLIFGALLGLARMVQGGHFFTDVVWSGAICWFTALGMYYVLKLDRSLVGNVSEKPMPVWLKIVTSLVAIGMITGILLGSPYREARDLFIVENYAKEGALDVNLTLAVGQVQIRGGEKFHITGEAWGHGVPTSDIGEYFVVHDRKPVPLLVYFEEISGWFMELESNLNIDLPWHRLREMVVSTGDAAVLMNVPKFKGTRTLRILNGNSDLQILLQGQEVILKNGDPEKFKFSEDGKKASGSEDNGVLHLEIADAFFGVVDVRLQGKEKE